MRYGLLLFLIICLMGGCEAPGAEALWELGLSPWEIGVFTYGMEDTHGGFHGDGAATIWFSVPDIREGDLEDLPGWRRAPLPKAVEGMLYGGMHEGIEYGAYPEDAPTGDVAYWFFRDRQNEKTDYTESELWAVRHRPSANFTLALWLPMEQKIWYFRFDS